MSDILKTIYPVILRVPEKCMGLTIKERVAFLSRFARKALEISAQKSGDCLIKPAKDVAGIPVAHGGRFWSITHKPQYVAGLAASFRVGIDIEKIKICKKALFRKTAAEKEWALGEADNYNLFFRYWTAKESVIKAEGTGLRDLLECQVIELIDDNNLVIHYKKKKWVVEHHMFYGHIASVVKNSYRVEWLKIFD